MNPTAAAVITKNSRASLLRTLFTARTRRHRTRSGGCRRIYSRLVSEPVSDLLNGQQVLRLLRVRLELLAKVADVHVDGARIAICRVPPDVLEQHLAAHHPPRPGGERGEQLELDVGQADRL